MPPNVRRRAPIPKETCPLALSAEILGDKWSLLIIREAFYGVVRYDDMLADIGAPRSMLTDRLSKLVNFGLLKREPYQEPGERVRHAYVLTGKGRSLGPTLIALSQWGEEHILRTPAPVYFVERSSQTSVHHALISDAGIPIALKDVEIKLRNRE